MSTNGLVSNSKKDLSSTRKYYWCMQITLSIFEKGGRLRTQGIRLGWIGSTTP
jgi:hypothetical protein